MVEALTINSNDIDLNKACIEEERKALLEFKHGLYDPSGNVVKVDLRDRGFFLLGGEISGSLLDLKHLTYLDLTFGGMIPPHLENTQLRYLDLFGGGDYPMRVSNLNWLSGLSSLNTLIWGPIPHVNLRCLRNLVTLDLSYNSIGGEGIEFLSRLSACTNNSLEELNLGGNQVSGFRGRYPNGLEKECHLEHLRLRGNMLTGDIPEQLCWLSYLHILDLALNNLSDPSHNA
ncbi:LRR receptor-like serine/threonine-protein kinase ERL2 [Vitis vinifera]|uniref:LRR receptor-like serine/threonine-protein kinase ERL2 n=1 Tax=Vitis vinifera TaxID=29760 RepID=A0A438I262_VITVI|nr:LRR receptor-like serine/threonine-protein kinase ERL2 [Vitis vinifera]